MNSIKVVKKSNICFVSVDFVCNKSQPYNEYAPIVTELPISEMPLYDSNGGEEPVILLYVSTSGQLIVRGGSVGKTYRISYSYPCK